MTALGAYGAVIVLRDLIGIGSTKIMVTSDWEGGLDLQIAWFHEVQQLAAIRNWKGRHEKYIAWRKPHLAAKDPYPTPETHRVIWRGLVAECPYATAKWEPLMPKKMTELFVAT